MRDRASWLQQLPPLAVTGGQQSCIYMIYAPLTLPPQGAPCLRRAPPPPTGCALRCASPATRWAPERLCARCAGCLACAEVSFGLNLITSYKVGASLWSCSVWVHFGLHQSSLSGERIDSRRLQGGPLNVHPQNLFDGSCGLLLVLQRLLPPPTGCGSPAARWGAALWLHCDLQPAGWRAGAYIG